MRPEPTASREELNKAMDAPLKSGNSQARTVARAAPDVDYWEKSGRKWLRYPVRPRLAMCTPKLPEGGPFATGATLLPTRETEVVYQATGETETIQDDWDGEDGHRGLEDY